MLQKKIADELVQQINRELHSAYIYLGMAAYCAQRNLDGFAHWMEKQAAEETGHAMKIYGYLNDRGAEIKLFEIPKPEVKFSSLKDVFEKTLEHERFISQSISAIASSALEEKDLMTYSFLDWFLKEQIEEEAAASAALEKVKMVGESGAGIMALNAEFGQRE